MKVYFSIRDDKITFLGSRREVLLKDVMNTSVEVPYLPKSLGAVVYTPQMEALPIPYSDGKELVDVCLKVEIRNQKPELIVLNDKPIKKNDYDYQSMVKKAIELQKQIH